MSIRPEIAERLRRPIPQDHFVVPHSLPVISFGDAFTADVATIALNPSWREFWAKGNVWLDGDKRRLESLRSLGATNAHELTDAHIAQTVARSNAYFAHQPYKTWFNPFNTLVQDVTGKSFYDGNVCHLDLVQWSTYEVQKNLGNAWQSLVQQDKQFLVWQLETTSATTFIMNGRTVVEELVKEAVVPSLESEQVHYIDNQGKPRSITVYAGRANGRTFIGWNVVIAYGVPKAARSTFIDTLRAAITV